MQRRVFLASLLLLAALPTWLPAVEVRVFSVNRNYVTEGTIDQVDWSRQALDIMADLPNYRAWAVKGMDGQDAVSAQWWENLMDFESPAPDILAVKYRLRLPWPIGTVFGQLRFQLDRSSLPMDELRLDLIDKVVGLEQLALQVNVKDSAAQAGKKQVQFRVAFRYEPLVDLLINKDEYQRHMQLVVGILTRNLEQYSQQRLDR